MFEPCSRDLKRLLHCTTTTYIQGNFLEQTLVTLKNQQHTECSKTKKQNHVSITMHLLILIFYSLHVGFCYWLFFIIFFKSRLYFVNYPQTSTEWSDFKSNPCDQTEAHHCPKSNSIPPLYPHMLQLFAVGVSTLTQILLCQRVLTSMHTEMCTMQFVDL